MVQLRSISLERVWPIASPEVLGYLELKDDELYGELRPNQVGPYVEGALEIGRQAGREFSYDGDLARLMDRISQSGTKVTFVDERKRESDKLVRAQYERRPPRILVYRPSLEQMEHFFLKSGYRVRPEDVIALHMCHEWFHHLEETRFGRTDYQLPKIAMRKIGPVTFKQSVESTREIAAHAFTQQVMGLPWYPLLLDVLITHSERKMKKEQIRDRFHRLRYEFEQLREAGTPIG